ncbi:MAG: RNA polymerase sigma-70 factor [Bacteroidales bacterium]|jgi:RNA polymerase sigma-70 factor (ECF subfamily)|nr:RNA polymerase sigma-70 factor [Bacteroidales bacterium]MDD3989206.1 RNA polymerase sigma-70 factor [Bacteroidales bacterium]
MEEYISGINRREEKSWENLFSFYYAPLCAYAEKFLRNHSLAEDIVQETLIKIWTSSNLFDNKHHLTYYLYKAVYNNSICHLRSNRITVEITSNMEDWSETDFATTVKEELIRRLYEEIQKLPAQRRKIIMMSIDGKSGKEIAELLQISPNTVKVQKAKAMSTLKRNTKNTPVLFLL